MFDYPVDQSGYGSGGKGRAGESDEILVDRNTRRHDSGSQWQLQATLAKKVSDWFRAINGGNRNGERGVHRRFTGERAKKSFVAERYTVQGVAGGFMFGHKAGSFTGALKDKAGLSKRRISTIFWMRSGRWR
ncbi:MAG: hypothetical protein ACLTZT_12780 [Butyricimonas faecalis]